MTAKLILPQGTVAPDSNLLDGIDSTAFAQLSFKTIKVGATNVDADSNSDTLELVGGSNIALTPDAANDKITIAVLEDASHRFVTDTDKTNWNAKVNSTGGTITGDLTINGTLYATAKSFLIPHPTKEGIKLRYGSLEGPENGIYVRGILKGKNVIELPEYWTKLIDINSITVQLTPIGKHQKLYVKDIVDNKVIIKNGNFLKKKINCFYTIMAERIDIDKLNIEI